MARFGTTDANREQIRALLASAVLYFWVEGGGGHSSIVLGRVGVLIYRCRALVLSARVNGQRRAQTMVGDQGFEPRTSPV